MGVCGEQAPTTSSLAGAASLSTLSGQWQSTSSFPVMSCHGNLPPKIPPKTYLSGRMMFLYFHHFAPRHTHRSFVSNRAALTASLSAITALSACGASPKAANLTLTTANALAISAQLPAATEGSSYTGSVTASGGTSPYHFVVTSGQIPQGINLDQSTGSITGTPSAAGNFNFGVTVSNSKGRPSNTGCRSR